MLRHIAERLVSLVVSLVVASLVVFAVIEIVPGDPAAFMLGLNASPEAVATLRRELGLEGAPLSRYLAWAGGMLTGDFGVSYTYRVPVSQLVADRLQVSLPLAAYALVLSTAIALPVGMLAAAKRGSLTDMGVMGATQLGIAVPNFWFAILLVLVFSIKLRLVGAGGFPGWEAGLWRGLGALTLPAVARGELVLVLQPDVEAAAVVVRREKLALVADDERAAAWKLVAAFHQFEDGVWMRA